MLIWNLELISHSWLNVYDQRRALKPLNYKTQLHVFVTHETKLQIPICSIREQEISMFLNTYAWSST